jgi:diguanylate cyclase (GGDEF)-like protein
VLLGCAGVAAALVGAFAVARSEAEKSRLAFHLASDEVASTLQLAIQHEEDLIVSASAFVNGNPQATPAQFDRWAQAVRALRRFPELQNVGFVRPVPAAQLSVFEARARRLPLRPFGATSAPARVPFEVFPPGRRSPYCFAVAGLARSPSTFLPPGLDYCALAPALLASRDSGQSNYAPFVVGHARRLGVETPVYSGGSIPGTVAERHKTFLGWLGVLLAPELVIGRARAGHENLAVVFRYDQGSSHVAFTSGTPARRAESTSVDLHNGWVVESLVAPVAGGLFSTWRAWGMLVAGTLLSLLVALLVFTLATGRRRALALVRDKTRELSHQAMHDPLTGLANRALVLENAERLIARALREDDHTVGALFMDVDDFKNINDSLGHAAGDELLKVLADRVRGTVRASDTAGRLGGDEFVVLLEALDRDTRLDELARRLISVLHETVALPGGVTYFPTVSIGVATGSYLCPRDLLRDADLALYEAKAAGKARYVLHEAAMCADVEGELEPAGPRWRSGRFALTT